MTSWILHFAAMEREALLDGTDVCTGHSTCTSCQASAVLFHSPLSNVIAPTLNGQSRSRTLDCTLRY
jgi:hypothetical protein